MEKKNLSDRRMLIQPNGSKNSLRQTKRTNPWDFPHQSREIVTTFVFFLFFWTALSSTNVWNESPARCSTLCEHFHYVRIQYLAQWSEGVLVPLLLPELPCFVHTGAQTPASQPGPLQAELPPPLHHHICAYNLSISHLNADDAL